MELQRCRDTPVGRGLVDEVGRRVVVDPSAELGVVERKCAGNVSHVRVGQFWMQEKADTGELRYREVEGIECGCN